MCLGKNHKRRILLIARHKGRSQLTIVVPHSKHVHDIAEGLRHSVIRVLEKSGVKIGNIVKKTRKIHLKMKIVLYTKFSVADVVSLMSEKHTEV